MGSVWFISCILVPTRYEDNDSSGLHHDIPQLPSYPCPHSVSFYFMKETHSCTCLLKWIFCSENPLNLDSPDGKSTFFREFLMRLGLYFLAHCVLVISMRMSIAKPNPYPDPDPKPINIFNKVIKNTVEQSVIFVGLYLHLLYDRAGDRFSPTQLAAFAGWFLVGRVVFSVGYFLGGLLKMEFMRSPGMACNFILVYLLIEAIYIPGGPLIPFLLGV